MFVYLEFRCYFQAYGTDRFHVIFEEPLAFLTAETTAETPGESLSRLWLRLRCWGTSDTKQPTCVFASLGDHERSRRDANSV